MALAKSLSECGITLEEDALRLTTDDSTGHPSFVQIHDALSGTRIAPRE